jgi:hypothetical protein
MTLSEAEKSLERGPGGKFLPGHGMGRPKGSRNKLNTAVLDAIGELTSPAVAVLREQLAQGNPKVAFYVLDRFLPNERSPAIGSTDPGQVADAIAEGHLTPTEASKLAAAMKQLIDADQVKALMARLDEIEGLLNQVRKP